MKISLLHSAGLPKAAKVTAALLISASLSIGTVWASDLEDQYSELQRQAEEQQEITNKAAAKVESLSEKMRILQEDVDTATNAYNEVKDKLDAVNAQIDSNTELLEKTEKDLKVKNKKLQQRVRDIYINGQRLNGHEFEQTLGDSAGQGSLA